MADLFSQVHPYHASLDYHLERHNLLASNIAHVDTPGFVPKDIAKPEKDSFQAQMASAIARTHPNHISPEATTPPAHGHVYDDPSAGAGNDKNFVSLDREAAKLAANQVRYDVIATIVTSNLEDLQFAANDGRSG